MAGVLRNLVRKRRRDEGRRITGESRVAADPSVAVADFSGSPELLLQQAQAFRVLAGLICELDEPRRKARLLRFYQDQTSEQIGHVLAILPGTARRQINGALALLRERMDRRYGDRRAWAGILAPGGAALTGGALTTAAPWAIGAGLSAAVVMVALFATRGTAVPVSMMNKAAPTAPTEFARLAILEEPESANRGQITGTVADEKGLPAASAAVLLHCSKNCPRTWGGDRLGTTDATGRFRFDRLAHASFSVTASAEGFLAAQASADVGAASVPPMSLVLKRGGFAVEGTVNDEASGPVAGAVILIAKGDNPALAVTAADGKYRLRLPRGTFITSVAADGYADLDDQAIEVAGDVDGRNFTLTPAATIAGVVVDVDG